MKGHDNRILRHGVLIDAGSMEKDDASWLNTTGTNQKAATCSAGAGRSPLGGIGTRGKAASGSDALDSSNLASSSNAHLTSMPSRTELSQRRHTLSTMSLRSERNVARAMCSASSRRLAGRTTV